MRIILHLKVCYTVYEKLLKVGYRTCGLYESGQAKVIFKWNKQKSLIYICAADTMVTAYPEWTQRHKGNFSETVSLVHVLYKKQSLCIHIDNTDYTGIIKHCMFNLCKSHDFCKSHDLQSNRLSKYDTTLTSQKKKLLGMFALEFQASSNITMHTGQVGKSYSGLCWQPKH